MSPGRSSTPAAPGARGPPAEMVRPRGDIARRKWFGPAVIPPGRTSGRGRAYPGTAPPGGTGAAPRDPIPGTAPPGGAGAAPPPRSSSYCSTPSSACGGGPPRRPRLPAAPSRPPSGGLPTGLGRVPGALPRRGQPLRVGPRVRRGPCRVRVFERLPDDGRLVRGRLGHDLAGDCVAARIEHDVGRVALFFHPV